jgi:hypothetical protein
MREIDHSHDAKHERKSYRHQQVEQAYDQTINRSLRNEQAPVQNVS